MPPLDFPNSPAVNDTWVGGNGATYTWDGTKWVVSGSSAGAYLLLAGGTMTGPIALAADPVTDPQAANKHYVDASINLAGNYLGTWAVASNTPNISAGGSISNANYVATTVNPATPETVPAGVPGIAGLTVGNGDRIIWASGLGVWQILRNAGVTLAAADARYYAITNPSGYQTAANVATALAPYAPLAAPVFTGDARAVTATYGDNDTSIATTQFVQSAIGPAQNNAGRNFLHNSMFNVQQRGAGSWTTNGALTVDRWALGVILDTITCNPTPLSDSDRAAIGDEAAQSGFIATFTGNAGASSLSIIQQRVEGVSRLAGKTITVSFWAATTVPKKLGVGISQNFGTGGSPSAQVDLTGVSVNITATWARYSVTFSMPGASGKTLGTSGNDFTELTFWYSAGTSFSARSGSVGVQSGTVNLWGVQLEIGSVATPLEKRDPADELALCQRFYQLVCLDWAGPGTAGNGYRTSAMFPVQMRAVPTTAVLSNTSANVGALSFSAPNNAYATISASVTASGFFALTATLTASADL